jgi:hypothetical protein
LPTVEDIDGRRTDCKRIMMISAMVLFLLLSKMIFPAPHSFPITLTLHTPFSAYQSSKKHAMKRPRQDPSIPNRFYLKPQTPFNHPNNPYSHRARVYLRSSVRLSAHMQQQLQRRVGPGANCTCDFHFFVPNTVADGGGYSWKLFKAIDKASHVICAAKMHVLDKIDPGLYGADDDLVEKKTRCFNKLNSELKLVDKFFTTFKHVVKTVGIFYHLTERRQGTECCVISREENEFLNLSIFSVMELIQGGTLHDVCQRIAAFNRELPPSSPPLCLNEVVMCKIASQVAAVLKLLTNQVVHRDIKPLNIMLCQPLSDSQLRVLCQNSSDTPEFAELLGQICIKIIDFGHPGQCEGFQGHG